MGISNLLLRLPVGWVVVLRDSEREIEGTEEEEEASVEEEEEEEEEVEVEEEEEDLKVSMPSNTEESCIEVGMEGPRSRCPDRDKGIKSKFPESQSSGTTHASMPLRMFCRRLSKVDRLCPFCIFQSMKSK